MQVKIGNIIYDSTQLPILLILSKDDRANIENMMPSSSMFLTYPEGTDADEIKKFMDLSGITYIDTPPLAGIYIIKYLDDQTVRITPKPEPISAPTPTLGLCSCDVCRRLREEE